MAYREPAEDEEAKLDAAEVDAFRQELARGERNARVRAYAIVLGMIAVCAGIVAVALAHWNDPAARPRHVDECHRVMRMLDVNGVLVREDFVECPDAAAP